MMRRAAAVGLAAAVLAAAGCGDDDGGGGGGSGGGGSGGSASADEAEIRKSLTDLFEAFSVKDVDKGCSLLSEDAKKKAAATVPGTDTCEEGMRRILDIVDSRQRESLPDQLEGTKISIEVKGDRAKVAFPERPDADPFEAVREGGEWKIDHNPLTYKPNNP